MPFNFTETGTETLTGFFFVLLVYSAVLFFPVPVILYTAFVFLSVTLEPYFNFFAEFGFLSFSVSGRADGFGFADGFTVAFGVSSGFRVGSDVSTGAGVGVSVGTAVGLTVGLMVGAVDGAAVASGLTVGVTDGLLGSDGT